MQNNFCCKGLVFGIVLLFVVIGIFLIESCSATGTTIYVDDDGGADYTRIQDAIDNASDGDTIIVRDGTYTENVDVNKRLTIHSENGPDTTIIQAANSGDHVFEVMADYVNISGFTIENATENAAGIYLGNVRNCSILYLPVIIL